MVDKFKRLKVISFIIRLINPGFSTCSVCGLPWNFSKHKTVDYNDNTGYFATCQYCWDNSPIDVIEKSYLEMHMMHRQESLKYNYGINYDFKVLLEKMRHEYNKDVNLNRINKIKKIKHKLKK